MATKKKKKEGKKKPRRAASKTVRAPKKARKPARKAAGKSAPKKKTAAGKGGGKHTKTAGAALAIAAPVIAATAGEFGAEEWKDEPDEIVQEDDDDLEADFHEVDELETPVAPLEKPADDDEEW